MFKKDKEKKPLVSVILSSYNHEEFIEKAIFSVLKQSYEKLELIVIDDGSTDRTPEKIKKIHDSRIQRIFLKHNREIHPRNLGLRLAKGTYVAFQNSDDEWKDDKLEKQIYILENKKNIVACFTGVEFIDKESMPLQKSWAHGLFCTKNISRSAWIRRFFDSGNCLCLPSSLIRKESIRMTGGFRGSLIQLSDFDLWVRLILLGDFHIINEPLIKMRILKGKNVSRPDVWNMRRVKIEFSEILERYAQNPVHTEIKKAFANVLPWRAHSYAIILAGLVRYAWSLNSPIHQLFANRLMSKLIDNSLYRKEIIDVYGIGIIHEFITHRGELELTIKKKKI